MRRYKIPKQKTLKLGDRGTEPTRSSDQVTRAKCMCGHGTRISWWWPWCVVMVTATVRIRYVMLPENWWILHPDEIFQSAEVAFSEAYGYGFRPYEYLPAPGNTSIPAEAQLLKSGMYGLRSPVYPRMFTIALYIARMIGLDQSPFMVCRVFNAAFTSLLPLTVFWFVLKLFHCRLLAFLTCALCAVEHHLAVFGTHTIVNSFISPVIFLGLTLCLPSNESAGKIAEEHREHTGKEADQNANIITKHCNGNGLHYYKELQQNKPNDRKNSGTDKRDTFSNHGDNVQIPLKVSKVGGSAIENPFLKKVCGGFLLGVVCYVRADTLLFCTGVMFPVLYMKRLFHPSVLKELTIIAIGGAAACMLCVADDWIWYGWGIISPVQWFKFNIMSGKASKLFGTEDANMYLQVFIGSTEYKVINVSMLAILLYCMLKQKECLLLPREFRAICVSFISNIIVFSCAGHKESRFIHNAIVFYIFIVSYGLHTLICVIRKLFPKGINSSLLFAAFLVVFALSSYSHYPSINTSSISEWTYGNARDSANVNTCLDWLRRQHDVSGVYVDASLYNTAGFTILKHDVPLVVKIHNEFYRFDVGRTDTQLREDGRLRVIHGYSDLIHKSNKVYLTKIISRDKTFNYVIIKSDVFSLVNSNYSYKKVFTHGQYSVFHRNLCLSREKDLEKLSENLPVGDNATVLEYETNWLITNGLYNLAIERAEMAMKIDSSRVRLYQQMFVCYSKLNNTKMLYHFQEECFRRFGKEACVRQHEKVVLHEHYNKFDQRY